MNCLAATKQSSFALLAVKRKKKTGLLAALPDRDGSYRTASGTAGDNQAQYPATDQHGRRPMVTMQLLYYMQQWYARSDPELEDALYAIESMCPFVRLGMTDDTVLDETTILKFHHFSQKGGCTAQMVNPINDALKAYDLLLKGSTMI